MNDEEIREELDRACQYLPLALHFQVSQQPPYLYIFINRPVGSSLDYASITTLLGETIADLELEHITYLALYSRPLGEVDHDWELCVSLSDFVQETIVVNPNSDLSETTIRQEIIIPSDAPFGLEHGLQDSEDSLEKTEFVEHRATVPFADEEEEETIARSPRSVQSVTQAEFAPQESDLNRADFSQYCFVSNPIDLSAPCQEIFPNVAKALTIFHRFPIRGKHRVLPLLGQIFEGDRGIVFIHFPVQVQQWFEYILTLPEEDIQAAKIWFSRYCQNSTETLREMQRLLQVTSDTVAPASELSSPEDQASSTAVTAPNAAVNPAANAAVNPAVNAAPQTIDARPRSRSASGTVQAQDSPPADPHSGATGSVSAELPSNLWMLLGLLGLGSLGLGFFNALVYQGLGLEGWLFLFITLALQAFSTATSNRALQKLQGALFTTAIILGVIFSSDGFTRGYVAGLLMGLGVGNILRLQLIQTQKRLPQSLSGLWELISDRTATIACATSVVCFALPLWFLTHPVE